VQYYTNPIPHEHTHASEAARYPLSAIQVPYILLDELLQKMHFYSSHALPAAQNLSNENKFYCTISNGQKTGISVNSFMNYSYLQSSGQVGTLSLTVQAKLSFCQVRSTKH